ncbi:MAG TPA: thioredoxin domain-containing protein [Longimicrobiales bacterium]|nr:thioredoxin domain-containing protein [Longimicrobiales bacterium]
MRLLLRVVGVGVALLVAVLARSCVEGQPATRGDVGQGGEVDVAGLGFFHGDPDAPLQIVEFTDPACPYCAQFHSNARDSLFTTYVATGRARWITIPWVSGQYATSHPAVVAVECAMDVETAERVTRALYGARESWVAAGRTASAAIVREIAVAAGIPAPDLEACLDDPVLDDRIDRADSLATALGIRGTPTYLIDGFPMMGAVPFAFARRAFDERLAELATDTLR